MTDDTVRVELMQQLQQRDLSDWSQDEIDGFIVDAYLSLKAAMRGQLYTTKGLLVEPYMDNWGKYEGGRCLACLAGTFFVSQAGVLLEQQSRPYAFYNDDGVSQEGEDMTVLTFLDGLRYLEEGGSIHLLLPTLGFEVPPVNRHAAVGYKYLDYDEVAARLERFIELNPRLKTKLVEVLARASTTTQDYTPLPLENGLVTTEGDPW